MVEHVSGAVLVADSFLVVDGRVRGLERHTSRFLNGVSVQRPHLQPEAKTFLTSILSELPRQGAHFPRLELRERDSDLWFRLLNRTAPPRVSEAVLATAEHDVRTHPTIKGPDLDALMGLRDAVAPLGADEAVIVDDRGYVVEGAYSALLWWRGDVLCHPDPDLPRISSVTAALVLEAARAEGVAVRAERARPDELAGCELWVVSALHGIRTATGWVAGPTLAPARLAARGRQWLSATEQPLYPTRGTPPVGG